MYMFNDPERKEMANRLTKAFEQMAKYDDEEKELRGRLAFIENERKALSEEEVLVKRAYRLNGWKGNYSLAGKFDTLDCDF